MTQRKRGCCLGVCLNGQKETFKKDVSPQALAAKIEDDNLEVVVPDYIVEAVTHVSKK